MSDRIPHMTLHKASGQAVVRLAGRDIYLGPWKSAAAKNAYDREIAQRLAGGRRQQSEPGITIVEIIAAFWDHAQVYYRHPEGTPTSEIRNYRDSLRPLRRLYGRTAATDFGPLALKAVRQNMIDSGLSRTSINRRISRIKHVFTWAAGNELIPATVYHALQAVEGLKAGHSEARESPPVRPVPDEQIDATVPWVSRQVAAMIQLQRITGMRPGEVVITRGKDIDATDDLWIYRPTPHKTQHHGHKREVFLGAKCKAVVKQFLRPNLEEFLFSPADAEADRRKKMHQARKTPLSCGNTPGSNVKRKPIKKPQDRYTVISYSRAIKYQPSSSTYSSYKPRNGAIPYESSHTDQRTLTDLYARPEGDTPTR